MALAVVFFAMFGMPIEAQSLPERYVVSGVDANDVLNIRAEPTAASDIIGEFGPGAQNVEILRVLDGWGYTGAGERSGWVSMRYLSPDPVPEGRFPQDMTCFGTEPFWTLTFYARGISYNELGVGNSRLISRRTHVAPNGYLLDLSQSGNISHTATITALSCNDGMSDRNFGMSLTLFTESDDGNSVRTGCCTLQVN